MARRVGIVILKMRENKPAAEVAKHQTDGLVDRRVRRRRDTKKSITIRTRLTRTSAQDLRRLRSSVTEVIGSASRAAKQQLLREVARRKEGPVLVGTRPILTAVDHGLVISAARHLLPDLPSRQYLPCAKGPSVVRSSLFPDVERLRQSL